ncbi:MAG: leucine-rich repeat domain-containing protein [Clostridia bacterium]|nr:leucine-rich repeat domain-containing protein [Clostridia bacterium]
MNKRVRICLIAAFLTLIGFIFCPAESEAENKTIIFSDSNMYATMRDNFKDKIISSDDENQSITMNEYAIDSIESINAKNKNITDLSGIENFTKLRSLNIAGNHITSIEKIPSENISSLEISYVEEISDFELIENYGNLYDIDVSKSNLEDVPEVLRKLPKLTHFTWNDGALKTTSWVKDFPKITNLTLKNNQISSIENISTLSQLSTLDLSSNKIENIDELGKCSNLISLYIEDNYISDIRGISKLKLQLLYAANNKITDINSINTENLSSLDVSNNNISNFDSIKDIAADKKYKVSGQLIKMEVKSGDEIDLPSIIKIAKENFGANDIEVTKCEINSDGKCKIDENVTYARIKINDGLLKNSLIYFNVTNVQIPGVTGNTINITKTHVIIIIEVLVIMVISVFIIAKIKSKKS